MRISILLMCTMVSLYAQAQRFYENGMLYSENMLRYWKIQTDSLQRLWQREKTISQTVYGKPFAVVHDFSLDTLVEEAYSDIQKGIKWEDFKHKYPAVMVNENFIVSFHKWRTGKKETVRFRSMFEYCHCPEIDADTDVANLQDSFVVETYRRSTPQIPGYLSGVFILKLEKPAKIPETYASWVRYSDFITGPEPLFLNKFVSLIDMYRNNPLPRPAHDRFFEYIDIPGMPQPSDFYSINVKYMALSSLPKGGLKPYRIWQEKRDLHIQENLVEKAEFKLLLGLAVEETIWLGIPDELLENWALAYLDEELGWAMMRLRPVYSSCGNDPAPTERLYEIARYCSSESIHWHGFIRAHLGLINDATDWSISYKTRFVGELENLGLDVSALLLASVLQMNEAEAHYEGKVKLTGWALAQCKNADQIAETICQGIADEQLDIQNRLILFRVYRHMLLHQERLIFNKQQKDEIHHQQLLAKIEKAQNTLPAPWRYHLEKLTKW